MCCWGVIVGAIGASQNWKTVMALRALQGVAECSISPAFLLLTGTWWTVEEHSFRSLIWGTANPGMGIITSLIMYGIGKRAEVSGGLPAWRAISVFLGTLTFLLGIVAYFHLGTPREVYFLSEEEKRIVSARTVRNNTGTDRTQRSSWDWSQFWGTFRDPQIYFFFFITAINAIPNGGVNAFGSVSLSPSTSIAGPRC